MKIPSIRSLQHLQQIYQQANKLKKTLKVDIPQSYLEAWNSDNKFIILKGGRGSAKTISMMQKILEQIVTTTDPFNILFAREFLKNVNDTRDLFIDIASQLKIPLKSRNKELIYENKIIYFRGAREPSTTSTVRMLSILNMLKNIPNLKYIMFDEAQDITENTLDVLIPTARDSNIKQSNSSFTPRFIFCLNPKTENDPVIELGKRRPESAQIIHKNIYDIEERFQNKSLLEEAEHSRLYDSKEKYEHIWLGKGSPLIQNPFANIEILDNLPNKEWERFYVWVDPAFIGYGKACTAICGLLKLKNDHNMYIFGEMYPGAWHSYMKEIKEFITKDMRWLYNAIGGTTNSYYESNSIGNHLRKIYTEYTHGEHTIIPIQTLGNKELKIQSKSYLHKDIKLIRHLSHLQFIKNIREYEIGAKSKIDGVDAMASLLEHLGL